MNVLFQGDSVTDCGRNACGGAGYENGGLGPGYPMLIASRLLCDRPEVEWHFTNRGISGNRIVDLYARWKRDTLCFKPDVLSILIGVNDSWHGLYDPPDGVEVPRYERIYRELLAWTMHDLPSVRLILMEPFLCPHSDVAKKLWPEIVERRAVVRKLSKEFGALFVPAQDIFDAAFARAPMNHWSADGVHPTPAGHQLIADAWIKECAANGVFSN